MSANLVGILKCILYEDEVIILIWFGEVKFGFSENLMTHKDDVEN